jgi:hypothetical protein
MVLVLAISLPPPTVQTQTTGCRFITSPKATPAFCDTFDKPEGIGNRSGDLNGLVWGISRVTSNNDPAKGKLDQWQAVNRNTCGTFQLVQPENDNTICNGHFVEGVNDGGNVTILAAYPKQPFDIAGRTGVVSFDVNDDTQGDFSTWPEFYYTDQPVPAPHHLTPGIANFARNSFGFSLAGATDLSDCVGVNRMFMTSNFEPSEIDFQKLGCVKKPTRLGELNHFEVRMSQSRVQVWGTDPNRDNIRLIAQVNLNMTLTRGLIWVEDVHYNANRFQTQGTHTFEWDNIGFDGPVLAKDLAFDAPDNNLTNLGYLIPKADTLTVKIAGVSNISKASAALLTFNFWPSGNDSLIYSVNGNDWHTKEWPFGFAAPTSVSHTIALPIPLSEVVQGTNSIQFKSAGSGLGLTIANIDLILVGAGS